MYAYLRRLILTFAVSATLAISLGPCQQESPIAETPSILESSENFSGTVVALSAESLSVVRRSLGKTPVLRVFTKDSNTLVEGNLKMKVRVTVRYQASDDGVLHAIHIIVR